MALNDVFWDRSRTATDDSCPRARYWGNEWRGIGLSPQGDMEVKLYLPFGSAIHKGLEVLAKTGDGMAAYLAALDYFLPILSNPLTSPQSQEEMKCLLGGFLLGYAKAIWPLDLLEFTVLKVEDEVILTLPGGEQIAAIPDLLLERKSDKIIRYKEFKTTGWANEGWIRSWSRAAQLLTGALAVQASLGRPLHSSVIQGLYKGAKYKGQLNSPFCYAHRAPDGEILESWKRGTEKVPVWELPGGIAARVAQMSMEMLTEQFPATPPIMFNEALQTRWLGGKLHREREIALVRSLDPLPEGLLQKHFPMHLGSCEPAMGSPCPFLGLCYNPQGADDPLWHGYVLRTPHLKGDPAVALRREMEND